MTKSRKSTARRGNSGGGNAGSRPGKGHNSGSRSKAARKEIIRAACQKITNLQAQRDGINADIREITNTEIKGALGMKVGDFKIALRLYQLEGADRDQLLDTVRETFEALGVGEQLDWVTASERASTAVTEHVDEGAEAAAVTRGPVGTKPKDGDATRPAA